MTITIYQISIVLYLFVMNSLIHCNQVGPDPWHIDKSYEPNNKMDFKNIPPDLLISSKPKTTSENYGMGEWFYRRLLSIMLKGGEIVREDGDVSVKLHLKFNKEKWELLDKTLNSNSVLSDDMLRRSIGYVEEAITKPSIIEQIVVDWNERIQQLFIDYKTYLVWSLGSAAILVLSFWIWNHLSKNHVIKLTCILVYLYEAFVSYKEVEKKEYEILMASLKKCDWYFWQSSCEFPPYDYLLLLKHMNPLKIGIRVFTTFITEPLHLIFDTVKIMLHGLTDDLWFPFNKIVYGMLIMFINLLLIILFVMIIFNYLLNIPFKLSIPFINIGLGQHKNIVTNTNEIRSPVDQNVDRISGATLDRFLDICSSAVTNVQSSNSTKTLQITERNYGIRRSASTGRLPNLDKFEDNMPSIQSEVRKRKTFGSRRNDGSGDAP